MGDPGPEGSIGKMAGAILNIDVHNAVMNLLGADGLLYGSYEMIRPETAMASDTQQKGVPGAAVRTPSRAARPEIMANILGERVLGLPGDVRVDREVPLGRSPPQLRVTHGVRPLSQLFKQAGEDVAGGQAAIVHGRTVEQRATEHDRRRHFNRRLQIADVAWRWGSIRLHR